MRFLLQLTCCLLLSTSPVFAEDLTLTTSSQHQIPVTHPNTLNSTEVKEVVVSDYELTEKQQETIYQQIQRRLEQQDEFPHASRRALPTTLQLGMAQVPVLDQGLQETCSVFAITAAMDAALKRGDYISQLCLLQLGNYLEKEGGAKSGWRGVNLDSILRRIEHYGVVSMANQHRYGCGGSRLYPAYYFTPSSEMLPEDYVKHHMLLQEQHVTWNFLFTHTRFEKGVPDPSVIEKMKTALNGGSRLVISALLPRFDYGVGGATGMHHFANDTWVLTQQIAQDILTSKKIPGHSMIMTGYDDRATVTDSTGQTHHGLFTLRNSWSVMVGDWGNFYMSYDYAEILIRQAVQINSQS